MAGSDYKIVLSASIDPKSVETELQTIQNKYKLILNISLNNQEMSNLQNTITSIQRQVSSINNIKANPLEPMDKTAIDFEGRVKNIQQELDRISKVKITSVTDQGDQKLTKGVVTYTNANATKTQQEEFEIAQKYNLEQGITYEYKSKILNETDNIAKREKEAAAQAERQAKEFEKLGLQADKFIEKSKSLSQTNPVVAKGIDLAKQLKDSIAADKVTGTLSQKTKDLGSQLSVVNERIRTGGKNFQSWTQELGIAIKRTIEWSMGIGLVYGALNQLKEGIGYVKDLNKEMTNIRELQVDGAKSNEEISKLAMSFNSLAREMSVSTLEVAQGSTEWLRQGKSISETQNLLKSTMMLSKLGAMDSAAATEDLTAVTNAYKISAENAVTVVDKLVQVDAKSATSSQEIVEALKRTASMGQLAGVSLNDLIGYIATVSSVSRKSAETIGSSFQSMFARMENIKLNGFDSEDQTTINDVEKTLAKVGISIRDSETSFRNMSDVLKDVHERWGSLNEIERAAISQSIAGTRQRENFLILMNNFDQALELSGEAANSSGKALERYGIYQDSIEASSNRLKSAWEKMWQKAINSDAVKNFYNLSTAILDLIDKAGGLTTIVTGLTITLALLNAELIKNQFLIYINSIKNAGFAVQFFAMQLKELYMAYKAGSTWQTALQAGFGITAEKAAFLTTTLAPLALAIGSIIALTWAWNEAVVKTQKAGFEGTAKAWADHLSKVSEKGESTKKVLDDYRAAIEGVNQAYERAGILGWAFINKQEVIGQGLKGTIDRLGQSAKSWDEYRKSVKEALDLAGYQQDDKGKVRSKYKDPNKNNKFQYLDDVKVMTEAEYALIEASKMSADSWVSTWQKAGSQVKDVYSNLISTLSQLQNQVSAVTDFAAKQFEGKFSFGDLEKLSEVYPDYLNALSIEQGRVELNTDKLRTYNIEKAKAAVQSAENAKAQAILNNASQKEIESLDKQISLLKNYVDQTSQAIPVSREYIHSVQNLFDLAGQSLGGRNMDEPYKKLGLAIATVNKQYENGEISSKEYFDALNQQIDGVDFSKVFGKNKEASQQFFAGLVLDAGQSLAQISSAFDSGQMSITDYTDSLNSLVGVFGSIGGIVSSFGESMGLSSGEVSSVTSAVDGMTSSVAELNQYQQMNIAIQQMMYQVTTNKLQAGSEEYNKYAQNVANAAAAVGYTYEDLNGKVYSGADQITSYLEQSNSNFMSFAGKAGNMTGEIVEKIVHQIGGLLVSLGEGISSFEGNITIKPKVSKWDAISAMVAGITGNFFNLPTIDIGISGKDVGAAISNAGAALQKMDFNMDEGVYKIPNAFNQVSDAITGASGAADKLADSIDKAGDASKKLKEEQDALKSLLDMVIAMIKQEKEEEKDALKEKLDNYKKIIDQRKELLDTMEQEAEYTKEQEKKNKKLADLENELLALQLDDSDEAKKKKLELEQQISDQKSDIEDDQRKHSIDGQKEALDSEYEQYKDTIDKQIAEIDRYLKESGTIARDAMALIDQQSSDLYNKLIEWNRKFGSGVDADVTKAWDAAYSVLDKFRNALGSIDFAYAYSQLQSLVDAAGEAASAIANAANAGGGGGSSNSSSHEPKDTSGVGGIAQEELNTGVDLNGNGEIGYHTGAKRGPVGGLNLGSNEYLSKLMAGEIVINPEQSSNFFKNILPSLMGIPNVTNNTNGGVHIEMPINVQGSLDEKVLPKLEELVNKVAEKFNSTLYGRGVARTTRSFST